MSRITNTKRNRIFERIGRDVVRKEQPAAPRTTKILCKKCRRPMTVGVGQIAFKHKVCPIPTGLVIKHPKQTHGTTGTRDRINTHEQSV